MISYNRYDAMSKALNATGMLDPALYTLERIIDRIRAPNIIWSMQLG